MNDSLQEKRLIDILLQYDLEKFGETIGFVNCQASLTDADAVALLNLAERLSRDPSDRSRNKCLCICGLLWEHRRPHWHALPGFIITLLSRIGLGPAMPMVDEKHDRKSGKLCPIGSIFLEAAVTARCLDHEVRVAGKTTLLLSAFQHSVWNAIDKYPRLGISAPTSAGKSHVLVFKTLDLLAARPGVAVFVVPTISLIQQVSYDFREAGRRLGIPKLEVLQSFIPQPARSGESVIYVLTQERALSAFAQPDAILGARIAVIDEVQNIERILSEDNDRSRTHLEVIQELELSRKPERVVISGPRLENIEQLTRQIFGPESESLSADLPPVVNVTYTFAKDKGNVVLKQYSTVSDTPRAVEISPEAQAPAFGGRQYTPAIHDLIATIMEKLANSQGTLVFSPNPRQATKTAIELAERIKLPHSRSINSLEAYVADTVHENYALTESLPSGIAFHHGSMPSHVRMAVEQAFSRQFINVVVCTTTLMQGVNLPAKNLIARNPHLFIKKTNTSVSLTPYEFANLRGRAGRLLKDFVGRSVVLDESSFSAEGEVQHDDFFGVPGKKVAYGYGQRFLEYRAEIMNHLLEGGEAHPSLSAFDLVAYVRRLVYRHGPAALDRLGRVGIEISDQEFNDISRQLDILDVPRDVCDRCPEWDPVQLDAIYHHHREGKLPRLPRTPFDSSFVDQLFKVLTELRSLVPYYYAKLLDIQPGPRLHSVLITARDWCRELSLHDIIRWGKNPVDLSWDEIDSRLDTVMKTVMYQLPKLLRPVALIEGGENPIIGFMELGAYQPATRHLIELGLPRDTAVKMSRMIGPAPMLDGVVDDGALVAMVRSVANQLSYWEQLQIETAL